MERHSRLPLAFIRGIAASLLCNFLAGCDNTPNPNFEKELMAQQQSAQRGDPYVYLQNIPGYAYYLQTAPEMRGAVAASEAMAIRGAYIQLLEMLRGEPPLAALAGLTQTCMPVLTRAGDFDTDTAINASNARVKADPLFAELTRCREAAIAAEDENGKEEAERAYVFRRFASTAMVMLSVSVTARGDESGLELWKQNTKLVMEDRPGFKFNPRMLLGGN